MKSWFLMLALAVCAGADALAQGSLCFSELLFQPRSGEAEYVELYNNTNAEVDLADYHIVRWVGDSLSTHYPLPQHTVAPHSYVVLTKNAASVAANYTVKYTDRMVECSLPTYPNDGGRAVLCRNDGMLVEMFEYSPKMHSRLLMNKAGVSLERRRYDKDVNSAGNWFSASSTSGYGTPGYENSQSTEHLVEEAAFRFSSPTLSPDGDGYQDLLEIEYEVADGSLMATVDLFNTRGTRVKHLLGGALLGTHGTMVWDCTDGNGQLVAAGQYLVRLMIYDAHGTRQEVRRSVAVIR